MPALTDCGEVCENAAKELGYRTGEPLSRLIVLDKGIAWYNGVIEIWPRPGARGPHRFTLSCLA